MVERVVRNDEAWGSNPQTSTKFRVREIQDDPLGDENLFDRRGVERRVESEAVELEPKRRFG